MENLSIIGTILIAILYALFLLLLLELYDCMCQYLKIRKLKKKPKFKHFGLRHLLLSVKWTIFAFKALIL